MNPSDLLVIVAESLPIEQAFDLMKWACFNEPQLVATRSVQWWCKGHAEDISADIRRRNK